METKIDVRVKYLGDNRIGGYLLTWRTEANPDFLNQYMTPATDLGPLILPFPIFIVEEGIDHSPLFVKVGEVQKAKKDKYGLLIEGYLDIHSTNHQIAKTARQLLEIIQSPKLVYGWAASSVPSRIQFGENGQCLKWPIFDAILTPTPAEPIVI